MNRVELACRWLYLDLLIEQIQRGPKFKRLPPARWYHGHKNEIQPGPKPGTHAPAEKVGGTRYTMSRRKWMDQVETEPINMPVPLRMPAKAYVYCDSGAPLKRTAEALKILELIENNGGDICGAGRAKKFRSPDCDTACTCILLEKHGVRHRCEHGYW